MKKILFLIPLLCLLGGCYDSNEPNDIAYVVALGIDSEEEGNYEFTIQFAKTTQISGGASQEGGKEGSNILEIISVKAPTVYSGMNVANQVVSKRFTLAHTKLIVISDEIAKKGVRDLFDTFGRNSDIRPNIYIAVSNGKAKEYLNNVKPVVEVNPVNYYRLIYESNYGDYVPRTILKEFYFQLEADDKQNILPLAGVNKENQKKSEEQKSSGSGEESSQSSSQSSGQEKGSQQGQASSSDEKEENDNKIKTNRQGFDFLMKDYEAGNIDVEKKNSSEAMGMAVFKDDKMIGTMDALDSVMYNMLKGNFKTSYVSFFNSDTPNLPITIALEQNREPSIKVKTEEDKPKARIKIYLEGQLISEAVNSPVEADIKETERAVEKETKNALELFLKKTTEEFDSDIVGFGRAAKMNFLSYDDFEKYDWTSKYKNIDFEIDVDFKLRRIGFIDLRREEEVRDKSNGEEK